MNRLDIVSALGKRLCISAALNECAHVSYKMHFEFSLGVQEALE